MSDLRETLFNITKSATKTTGDLFKTTKLNMGLANEQTALKNLYMEIGKKVHEIYQYGGTLGKFFDEKYLELEAAERKIAEIKEQIAVIKGVRECPKCAKPVERSAEFCPKCGIRLEPQGLPTVDLPQETQPPPVAGKACRICKTDNEPNAKFCLSCGRIVD